MGSLPSPTAGIAAPSALITAIALAATTLALAAAAVALAATTVVSWACTAATAAAATIAAPHTCALSSTTTFQSTVLRRVSEWGCQGLSMLSVRPPAVTTTLNPVAVASADSPAVD